MSSKPKYAVRVSAVDRSADYGKYAHVTIAIYPATSVRKPAAYVAEELESGYCNAERAQKILDECRQLDATDVIVCERDCLELRFQSDPDCDKWYGLRVESMPAERWACHLLTRILAACERSAMDEMPYAVALWLDANGGTVARLIRSGYGSTWAAYREAPTVANAIPATPWAGQFVIAD